MCCCLFHLIDNNCLCQMMADMKLMSYIWSSCLLHHSWDWQEMCWVSCILCDGQQFCSLWVFWGTSVWCYIDIGDQWDWAVGRCYSWTTSWCPRLCGAKCHQSWPFCLLSVGLTLNWDLLCCITCRPIEHTCNPLPAVDLCLRCVLKLLLMACSLLVL